MCASTSFTCRFRMMGWIPLVFFALHFHYHWSREQPANILWMCHVSNVILAIGWMSAWPGLIRVAVLWLIPGLPLWIMESIQTGEVSFTSVLTHLGGLALGLILLYRVRSARWTWLYAMIWYLALQQICRMASPEALNVNIAHRMRAGWEGVFSAYWQYWLFTSLLALGGLWGVNRILQLLFPVSPIERNGHGDPDDQ